MEINKMQDLPVVEVLPQLKMILQNNANGVLVAPPGAGKTTCVPLTLLGEAWLKGGKIVMLEPRRLAARAVARYMALQLGEPVGKTVGYRVHMDSKVSPETRLEVVTEGILTRMLQTDPALESVGLLIFDEYHERSLQGDVGLALALESQSVLRTDLRILVMSATLEAESVAQLLGDAPVVISEGKSFPVETHYLPQPVKTGLEKVLAAKVYEVLQAQEGDILAFLPGAGEIRKAYRILQEKLIGENIVVLPLYGELPQEQQDMALRPGSPGQRKVILATSIAETSLTVQGVRSVIDSGLMRAPKFSPRTGMSRLETMMVSRPSADQRRGRAGRLGPGYCYRLWTEGQDAKLMARSTPEILAADLTPLALELAAWGVQDPQEMKWLDVPPQAAYQQAKELLKELGAIDDQEKITVHGRQMNQMGLHPRLAHMLIKGAAQGMGLLACCLAVLLKQRDVIRSATDVDLRLRLDLLQKGGQENLPGLAGTAVDSNRIRQVKAEIRYLQNTLAISDRDIDVNACGILLAWAYPDRIGQGKGKGRFLLRNGRGASLGEQQLLAKEAFIVVADLADEGADGRIFLAAPVAETELRQYMPEQIKEGVDIYWDAEVQAVRAKKYQRLGALTLKEEYITPTDEEKIMASLLEGIAGEGLEILPWTKGSRQLKMRLQFLHGIDPAWPDVGEASLLATMEDWLKPYLYGCRNIQDLKKLNLSEILEGLLTWEQRQILPQWAPTHLEVPSGRRIAIDYTEATTPVLAVKLQELFGVTETPVIAGGRVTLMLHLLSPAGRPIQVTRDLASFWREGYFSVKKDLKGRYPKHAWPDDPGGRLP